MNVLVICFALMLYPTVLTYTYPHRKSLKHNNLSSILCDINEDPRESKMHYDEDLITFIIRLCQHNNMRRTCVMEHCKTPL
jgi:hypothetical protein